MVTLPCRSTQPTIPPGISYQAAPLSYVQLQQTQPKQLTAGEKLLQKASALPHLLPADKL